MPPEMRGGGLEVRNGKWSFLRIALGVFLVLIVLVAVLMGRQTIANVFRSIVPVVTPSNETPVLESTILTTPPNVSPSDTFTLEPTFTPIPSQTFTPSFTPTASSTPTFTPSPTSTPRRVLSMDVPLGLGNEFLVHRVLDGESLELFANMYHTTIEAIRAVNYYLPTPLWVDYVVVIPLEPGNIQNIPPFEPYKVEKNITVRDLAQKLTVDASVLAYYNALNGGDILMPGDWLLIPRAKPTPTP